MTDPQTTNAPMMIASEVVARQKAAAKRWAALAAKDPIAVFLAVDYLASQQWEADNKRFARLHGAEA